MKEAIEFYKKHGLEECKKAYALSVNAGCEDLYMKQLIDYCTLGNAVPHRVSISFVSGK